MHTFHVSPRLPYPLQIAAIRRSSRVRLLAYPHSASPSVTRLASCSYYSHYSPSSAQEGPRIRFDSPLAVLVHGGRYFLYLLFCFCLERVDLRRLPRSSA